MIRPAFVAVVLASMCSIGAMAGCDEGAVLCTVDLEVARDTKGANARDCGSFSRGSVNYTDAAMLAAQQCVLNAIKNELPFSLVYDASSSTGRSDSGLRAAFVGTRQGQALALRTYAGNAQSDMAAPEDFVGSQACQSIDVPSTNCAPHVGVPCLTCTPGPDDVGLVACRGR